MWRAKQVLFVKSGALVMIFVKNMGSTTQFPSTRLVNPTLLLSRPVIFPLFLRLARTSSQTCTTCLPSSFIIKSDSTRIPARKNYICT